MIYCKDINKNKDMEIKEFINHCIKSYNDGNIQIITKIIKKPFDQFEQFDNITELNKSSEVYSYGEINNAIGFFNNYYIELKNNIIFDNIELEYLKMKKIPFVLTYNIITLRFLNYDLNNKKDIKILIGYFYSNYSSLIDQLYLNGIDDNLILKYFSIGVMWNYIEDSEYNIFYNKTQSEFYNENKNRIHHKFERWLKNDKIKDDFDLVLSPILINIKKNRILMCIFKQIFQANKKITKDDFKQFSILNISEKIKQIKLLLRNNSVPNYISSESIYSLLVGEFEKYDTTITLDFVDNFLTENNIVLIKKFDEKDIVDKIIILIKQGRYLKNKTNDICEYLNISIEQFNGVLNKYKISKPFQEIEKQNFDNYFKNNYPIYK
jgi:hypothetical protein